MAEAGHWQTQAVPTMTRSVPGGQLEMAGHASTRLAYSSAFELPRSCEMKYDRCVVTSPGTVKPRTLSA